MVSEESDTDSAEQVDRREFLKRSAGASLGLAAVPFLQDGGQGNGQNGGEGSHRYRRRMVFRKPEALSDDYVRRIVMIADPTRRNVDPSKVEGCGFDSWPPDTLNAYEGVVVEWENDGGFVDLLTERPRVRAQRMVQREMLVPATGTDIRPGTPFIVGNAVDCPSNYVGVLANRIPGLRVR